MPGSGSAQLRAIAVQLKAAGDRGNMNALRRGIRATVTSSGIPAVRAAAIADLPKRGGLNQYEASQKIRVSVLTGARTTGVRVSGKASRETDTGTWRRPAYPRGADRSKWKWREQTYGPAAGWWSDTWRKQAVVITPAIGAELEKVRAKIMGA